LGLPADVVAVLKLPAGERTSEQTQLVAQYIRKTDLELIKRQHALAKAQFPLPEDPSLKALKATLVVAELPVPTDPKLAQLRTDAAMSSQQLTDQRLTGAQDLAWAIINNPAFLFNR
jgi:hypothetical protein